MRNSIIVSGIVLFLLVVFVSSCKDDEPEIRVDLLTATPWNLSSLEIRLSQGPISTPPFDGYAEMADCNKDDLFDFLDDGQLQVLENSIKCPNSDNDVVATGNWSLTSSKLQISSDYFSQVLINESLLAMEEYDFEVKQLTSNRLELFSRNNHTDPANPQITYTVEINMVLNAATN